MKRKKNVEKNINFCIKTSDFTFLISVFSVYFSWCLKKMKIFVIFAATLALAYSLGSAPTILREDGRTPWSERLYIGPSPFIVRGTFQIICLNFFNLIFFRDSAGEPADIANFPHMLALLDNSRGGFMCGASTISTRWALSAAHCLERNTPPQHIQLRGGSTARNSGGFLFTAQSYTLHPQYNPRTLSNDIAVIQTLASTPIQGTNVRAIAIPPNCNTICCTTCDPELIVVTG